MISLVFSFIPLSSYEPCDINKDIPEIIGRRFRTANKIMEYLYYNMNPYFSDEI